MTFCKRTARFPSCAFEFAELGGRSCAIVSNVYLLLDYGNFTDGSASGTSPPYAQILSTTNPAEAHADFVATRLSGNSTTGS